jgi:hypothetical protein
MPREAFQFISNIAAYISFEMSGIKTPQNSCEKSPKPPFEGLGLNVFAARERPNAIKRSG